METFCGGPSKEQDATPDIQKLCDKVKASAEEQAGAQFEMFVAKSFTTQVVAGTNYFIKVHVGGDDFVHLRVFKPLPHTGLEEQLSGIQSKMTLADPISCF